MVRCFISLENPIKKLGTPLAERGREREQISDNNPAIFTPPKIPFSSRVWTDKRKNHQASADRKKKCNT